MDPEEIADQAASVSFFKKVLALPIRGCMIEGMKSLESILFNQSITARVSLSVRTIALRVSVINPGHLFMKGTLLWNHSDQKTNLNSHVRSGCITGTD